MHKYINILFGLLFAASLSAAAPAVPSVPAYLQEISVTIQSGHGTGSGVIFTRQKPDGSFVNFVWTAGHVVDDLRREREVVAADGSKKTVVEFGDAKVVTELRESARTVGRLELDAEVLKYSDATHGEDLALLRVRKTGLVQTSAKFYLEPEVPAIGTELYHVGSLLGQMGANSMTTGIVSQHGRLVGKVVYDQTTVAAFPGSSGGGVFLRDGRYVGMLVRGAGETFNLVVPIRRLYVFAQKSKILWAVDSAAPLPGDEELARMPIEDVKIQIPDTRLVK